MKRLEVLGILLALGAATWSAANDTAVAATSGNKATDDDMTEFLAVVTDTLTDDDAAATDDTNGDAPSSFAAGTTPLADGRLQKHLGLGFADGLSDDPAGQYNDNCSGNGHSGVYINSFGYRDCGDPSPSD